MKSNREDELGLALRLASACFHAVGFTPICGFGVFSRRYFLEGMESIVREPLNVYFAFGIYSGITFEALRTKKD